MMDNFLRIPVSVTTNPSKSPSLEMPALVTSPPPSALINATTAEAPSASSAAAAATASKASMSADAVFFDIALESIGGLPPPPLPPSVEKSGTAEVSSDPTFV
jgi:hypothetical protein